MKSVFIKCNQCGCEDFKVIYREGKAQKHRIVKCNNCGLIYANPQEITSPKPLDENEISEKQLLEYNPETNQFLKKQYVQLQDQLKVLSFIEKRNKGVLMEVGSNAGVFCAEAKNRGWKVIGVDCNTIASMYAKRNFGVEVKNSTFEDLNMHDMNVSVIVCFHVIEHVHDPKKFINKAYDILEDHGLLIMETPTYDSITYKLLKHRERSIRHDGHVFMFTRKSLKMMVESCGFQTIKQELVGRTLTFGRLLTNIGIILGKKNMFDNIIQRLHLERHNLTINMRDMQRIYCEKII